MITRQRVLFVEDDTDRTADASRLVKGLGHDVRVACADEVRRDVVDADLVIADVSGAPGLASVLEHLRPLCVAGIGDGEAAEPFDYVLARPLHVNHVRRLLWLVEMRRIARGLAARATRVRDPVPRRITTALLRFAAGPTAGGE